MTTFYLLSRFPRTAVRLDRGTQGTWQRPAAVDQMTFVVRVAALDPPVKPGDDESSASFGDFPALSLRVFLYICSGYASLSSAEALKTGVSRAAFPGFDTVSDVAGRATGRRRGRTLGNRQWPRCARRHRGGRARIRRWLLSCGGRGRCANLQIRPNVHPLSPRFRRRRGK